MSRASEIAGPIQAYEKRRQAALLGWQRRRATVADARFHEARKVILLADDAAFGLFAGDMLAVEPYWLDPGAKFTVLTRVFDGYNANCNVYRCQVQNPDGTRIRCNCGCGTTARTVTP